MASQFNLMRDRRFLPYFIAQFLTAFNDNLLKTLLAVMIAYGLWDIGGHDPAVLVAVAAALFILPFVLFCPLAGALCDKYDKDKMIRIIKGAEIIIALGAIVALFSGNLIFAFIILLLLGAQSAFFSPCKLAILPALLKNSELIGGNALVTTGTYLAILAGTIIGTLFALMDQGKIFTAGLIMICALIGFAAACFIPKAKAPSPKDKISLNIFEHAWHVFHFALEQKRSVLISIIGVAWFYFVAATFHSQFPNFTKITLGSDNIVLLTFMIMFSVGIGIGGLLNNKLLNAKVDTKFVPLASLAIVFFGVLIYALASNFPKPAEGESLLSLTAFVSLPAGAQLLTATLLQAIACGFYVVPLRALVQERTQNKVKARVISSSNLLDALFILAASIFSALLLALGVPIEELYGLASALTLIMAALLYKTRGLA